MSALEPPPLFSSIRNCPLLGFLDGSKTRIGCLGHPFTTGGVDLRDCGVYTAQICDSFFCPSHGALSDDDVHLVADACSDFYLYGLVVTDASFVHQCLRAAAAVPQAADATRMLFALKEELAPGSEGIYGAFKETGDRNPSGEGILSCLGADTLSGNDISTLEEEIFRRLEVIYSRRNCSTRP